ncbi:DNA polymerase [Paludisphaera mucosa]|uniref:DNA polymerase n=1 Tax=Paludisphaera mucosa TaxID=3030827 RepID=A0ABT6FJL1_9BACT|nr:DNA polymerase [Paludisphaera mucosa]MDG3007570.1 DNA polymerase [Paludisphaera mucosa]
MRLLDQDRSRDGGSVHVKRFYHKFVEGLETYANYKLKDVVPRLTGIVLIHFEGLIDQESYGRHRRYLKSDLVGDAELYDHLMGRLAGWRRVRLRGYHRAVCAPITPVLVEMRMTGVAVDAGEIDRQVARLEGVLQRLDAMHESDFGRRVRSNIQAAGWLWGELKLEAKRRRKSDGKPSLDVEHFKLLKTAYEGRPDVLRSLTIIGEMRQAEALLTRIRPFGKHIDPDGRVRSDMVDRLATGRIVAQRPNLQAMAKPVTIGWDDEAKARFLEVPRLSHEELTFRSRDVLVASPGFKLVTMDLAQADVRVLAHEVDTCKLDRLRHTRGLRRGRAVRLGHGDPTFDRIYEGRLDKRNPYWEPKRPRGPKRMDFDPSLGSDLARDFKTTTSDFYSVAATKMLGKRIDKRTNPTERNRCKEAVLSVVNLMGATSLGKKLGVTTDVAKTCPERFESTYPNEIAFRRLIEHSIAVTGRTSTFMGRERTDSAHHWLVNEKLVEAKVQTGGAWYWILAAPVDPRRHVLTFHLHEVWECRRDGSKGETIYTARENRVRRSCGLLCKPNLEYYLPYRNVSWRSIRAVRTATEQVDYMGLDKVCRGLFNAICQGRTADIVKWQMIRVQPILGKYGARLLLQIHDELVFEVPDGSVAAFKDEAVADLSVVPGFSVPLVLEPKWGERVAVGFLRNRRLAAA